MNAQDVAEEAFQTTGLPEIQFYKLGFISRTGFAHDVRLEEIIHFTLEDFYS